MSFSGAMEALSERERELISNNETLSVGINVPELAKEAHGRGKPPVYPAFLPPPEINRAGYIGLHNANSKVGSTTGENANGSTTVLSRTTMRPHVQHGPAPPILSLRATTLREIAKKVNHIHEDSILFAKTIYDSHRIIGTNLLVEDDSGDCLLFSVYNFVPPSEDPQEIFPPETYLAILAPYMRNSGDDPSRNLLLRCDNPDCIRIFPSRRSWLAAKHGKKLVDTKGLDPHDLRKKGNIAFSDERYEAAARCYTRALECQCIEDSDKLACLSNLAEVKLRQEQWESAELNAKAALELAAGHSKAKFRLASALINMNKLDEASVIIAHETGKTFQRLRNELKNLLREREGEYNLAKMRKEAAQRPGQALSTFHADFISPKIKQGIEITKRKGIVYRGTVAKEEIEGNCLILSSKALVFCNKEKHTLDLSINPYTMSMLSDSSMALENKLVLLMHQRPSLRETIYSLSSGLEGSTVNPNHKIDIQRLHGIVTSNTFGVSGVDGVEATWEKFKQQSKDSFQHATTPAEEKAFESQFRCGSGFWSKESLFNHSCIANCAWQQLGDQMFVRTTRDIDAGEELTVPYVSYDLSFSDREKRFGDWIQPGAGFQCQCDWCHSVRHSSKHQKVEKQVGAAYRRAAHLISTQQMKMAEAAEYVMPEMERKAAFQTFSTLPLPLQHNACADLWVMEGACEASKSNPRAALAAYQKAAGIKFAVRGGYDIERAKDLWRVVGASMCCANPSKAMEILIEIYRDIFSNSFVSVDIRDEAFAALTQHYSMPWWHDSPDMERQSVMIVLIQRAIAECQNSKRRLKNRAQQRAS